MGAATYSRKQFEEIYGDPAIKSFFKHIDRATADDNLEHKDFFRFYGMPKELIQAENKYHYKITAQAAPVFAAMIHSFQAAYGDNSRSKQADSIKSFPYEQYHRFVETLEQEVNKLEPYQKALIQNYRCVANTYIADSFLPALAERIAILLITLFCYGKSQSAKHILAINDELERLMDKIILKTNDDIGSGVKLRLDDELEIVLPLERSDEIGLEVRNDYTGWDISFEMAIGEVMRLLSMEDDYIKKINHSNIEDFELIKIVLGALNENIDADPDELTNALNKSVADHFKNKKNPIEVELEKIRIEHELRDSFWNAEVIGERMLITTEYLYRRRLVYFLETIIADYSYCKTLKELHARMVKRAKEALELGHWHETVRLRGLLNDFNELEDAIDEYLEKRPEGDDYQKFLDKWVQNYIQEAIDYREYCYGTERAIEFYNEVRQSSLFKSVNDSVHDAIAKILPVKLKR